MTEARVSNFRLLAPHEREGNFRILTEEERGDAPKVVGMPLIRAIPDVAAPKVGESFHVDVSIVDLQSSEEPTFQGKTLVDLQPKVEFIGSDGIVHTIVSNHHDQGRFSIELHPDSPGMCTVSISAGLARQTVRFQVLP